MSHATNNVNGDAIEECLVLLIPSSNLEGAEEDFHPRGHQQTTIPTSTTEFGRRVSFHTHTSQDTTTVTDFSEETTPKVELSNTEHRTSADAFHGELFNF